MYYRKHIKMVMDILIFPWHIEFKKKTSDFWEGQQGFNGEVWRMGGSTHDTFTRKVARMVALQFSCTVVGLISHCSLSGSPSPKSHSDGTQ